MCLVQHFSKVMGYKTSYSIWQTSVFPSKYYNLSHLPRGIRLYDTPNFSLAFVLESFRCLQPIIGSDKLTDDRFDNRFVSDQPLANRPTSKCQMRVGSLDQREDFVH